MTVYWDNVSYCNKVLYDIATPRVPLPAMKCQITNINNPELVLVHINIDCHIRLKYLIKLYNVTVYWDNVSYCNKVLYDIATPRVPLPAMKCQITNINNPELVLVHINIDCHIRLKYLIKLYNVTVYWDNVSYCNKVLYDIATPRVPLPVRKRQITNINNLELVLDPHL